MKKLINDPEAVVREMLEGAAALAPSQAVLADETVVVRRPLPPADAAAWPVAVLSGGGSGHEPAHAGFVGVGMLAAAVVGNVFTSPSVDAVLAGLRAVTGPAGTLMIVKNYTGDRLNFGLAAEIARAEGLPVEVVVVADDVALRDTVERERRRGIAGTVLVHKVAGAAAAAGLPLNEVAVLARQAAEGLGSMGVALGGCTLPSALPGAGRSGFQLAEDEIELGLGIHGEPGVRRVALRPADELAGILVKAIADDLSLRPGEQVALLVNGLGATPPMELDIVLRGALAHVRARGIGVARAWRGTLLSALDMPGCSITLMRLDDRLTALLDAPTDAPAWPGPGLLNPEVVLPTSSRAEPSAPEFGSEPVGQGGQILRRTAEAAASALLAAEAQLTELDAKAGDGDLGVSMTRAARAILDLPDRAWCSPTSALAAAGEALRRAVGGSSGPFYATALLRASRYLSGLDSPAVADWAGALTAASQAVSELGGARPGDRTMIDALDPAARALTAAAAAGPVAAARACIAAARDGASSTAGMMPRLGRGSYMGNRVLGVPDGGAVAVQVWLGAICDWIEREDQ